MLSILVFITLARGPIYGVNYTYFFGPLRLFQPPTQEPPNLCHHPAHVGILPGVEPFPLVRQPQVEPQLVQVGIGGAQVRLAVRPSWAFARKIVSWKSSAASCNRFVITKRCALGKRSLLGSNHCNRS